MVDQTLADAGDDTTAHAATMAINEIQVGKRLRPINDAKVDELQVSIQRQGLLQRIVVADGGKLVGGAHRLEACRRLGWTKVPVEIVEFDAPELRELAEIDENLVRHELSPLEQAEHLRRRDDLLKALKKRSSRGDNQHGREGGPAPGAGPVTTAEIAKQVGLKPRTVRERIQIANRLGGEVKRLLRQAGLEDRTRILRELARVNDADEQLAVAEVLTSGKASTVHAAKQIVSTGSPSPNAGTSTVKRTGTLGSGALLAADEEVMFVLAVFNGEGERVHDVELDSEALDLLVANGHLEHSEVAAARRALEQGAP